MVEGGAGAPLWTARGATLSWAQYFWFRHVFLLPPQESKCLLVRLHEAKLWPIHSTFLWVHRLDCGPMWHKPCLGWEVSPALAAWR